MTNMTEETHLTRTQKAVCTLGDVQITKDLTTVAVHHLRHGTTIKENEKPTNAQGEQGQWGILRTMKLTKAH